MAIAAPDCGVSIFIRKMLSWFGATVNSPLSSMTCIDSIKVGGVISMLLTFNTTVLGLPAASRPIFMLKIYVALPRVEYLYVRIKAVPLVGERPGSMLSRSLYVYMPHMGSGVPDRQPGQSSCGISFSNVTLSWKSCSLVAFMMNLHVLGRRSS